MPDVVWWQEVPDRGVTDPPWPELIEAGGRSVAGRIVGIDCSTSDGTNRGGRKERCRTNCRGER